MSVMFLDATAKLLQDLVNNVYTGSFMPGIDGATGSLVQAIGLS
ncbi:hypothetical protein [Rhodococcus sp. ACT016]